MNQIKTQTNYVLYCVSVLLFCIAPHLSLAASLPDFTRLIEANAPAVVKINTTSKAKGFQLPQAQIPEIFRHLLEPDEYERDLQSMGSGFFISSDGYLITNNHVVEGADEIVVQMTDRREFQAVVVGTDARSDLALLKVEEEGLPYLKMAKPNNLKVGEWVLAIGSPFDLEFSASVGIVSAIGRSIVNRSGEDYVPFIQTDVAINPGNSGGPLFNLDGEVVGVNSQIYTRSGGSIGLSFAIPTSVVSNVIEQLKEKGRVDRGWLGVVIQDVNTELARTFGLKKPGGALISNLVVDGPADRAGLEAGDVITHFNKQRINTSGDLPHAVGATAPGTKVDVIIMREKKRRTIEVEIGTLKANGETSIASADKAPTSNSSNPLGVEVENLDERTRERWNLQGGVRVLSVEEKSPAALAGVGVGDVIAQLGFEKIHDVETFRKILDELPKETLLPIRYFSEGQAVFRTFTLKDP